MQPRFGKAPVLQAKDLQRRAEECQRMAHTSTSDREKRSWLDLAEAWLRMAAAPAAVSTAEEKFDAEVSARETSQSRSLAKN